MEKLEDCHHLLKNKKAKKPSQKTIAVLMMDQSIFSGIGNYLKSEILYQSKVSPNSIISNIPDEKMKEIFQISLGQRQSIW